MNNKLTQLFKSRKFWAAVGAVGIIIFRALLPDFPISDENLANLVLVTVAYILGTAIEDGGSKFK